MDTKGVEIVDGAQLIAMIRWANKYLRERERSAHFEKVGACIKASVPSLSREDLIEISAEFSAAFIPLRYKPPYAREITILIDRTVMRRDLQAHQCGKTDLPASEYTPHSIASRVGIAL